MAQTSAHEVTIVAGILDKRHQCKPNSNERIRTKDKQLQTNMLFSDIHRRMNRVVNACMRSLIVHGPL